MIKIIGIILLVAGFVMCVIVFFQTWDHLLTTKQMLGQQYPGIVMVLVGYILTLIDKTWKNDP